MHLADVTVYKTVSGGKRRGRAAGALSGWDPPESVELGELALWQQDYLRCRPSKGWPYADTGSRSEAEQSIVNWLAGRNFGASDEQIREIADRYFAKHREERARQGYAYLDRTIRSARRHHFKQGWITSPRGGPPRRRDVRYRHRTVDDLEAALQLVRGQSVAEWVSQVCEELGWSSSTAYDTKAKFAEQGFVGIQGRRIYRT